MGLLGASAAFQVVLVIMVDCGVWPFKGNAVFANTVASELFLQIAGMGLIAVKFLFSSQQNPVNVSKPDGKRVRRSPPAKPP